jgi:hypothetical protein
MNRQDYINIGALNNKDYYNTHTAFNQDYNKIKVNDVVQIKLHHPWCGCFVIVTQVEDFGIKGYVPIPNHGEINIELEHDEYKRIGDAEFVSDSPVDR